MAPTDVFLVVAGYVLGSLPVAFAVGRLHGIDIRAVGSGNVGATNAFRTLGPVAGAITLFLDIAKGAAAVLLAERIATTPAMVAAAGACAVAGHIFPVWLGFAGGKGVATAAGVFGLLSPEPVGYACLGFLAALGVTRYVSMASLVAAAILVVSATVTDTAPGVRGAAIVCALLIVHAHRGNIGRVLSGSEPKVRRFRTPR